VALHNRYRDVELVQDKLVKYVGNEAYDEGFKDGLSDSDSIGGKLR